MMDWAVTFPALKIIAQSSQVAQVQQATKIFFKSKVGVGDSGELCENWEDFVLLACPHSSSASSTLCQFKAHGPFTVFL
jgi:hypothetical protein